jgi:hypothetical protein
MCPRTSISYKKKGERKKNNSVGAPEFPSVGVSASLQNKVA